MVGKARVDNVRSSVIEDAVWALVKESLPVEVYPGMCSLGEGEQLCWALISRERGWITWFLRIWPGL